MRGRIGSRTTLIAVVLALVVGAGCGGSGGGGSGGDQGGGATSTPTGATERTPTSLPTSTPELPTPADTALGMTPGPTGSAAGTTPVPSETAAGTTPVATVTPVPVATTVRVDFTVTSAESLLGFQFTALYPAASGSFTGSGAHVQCPLGPSGIFVKNDQDDGHLILAAIDTSPFPPAFNISCTFDILPGRVLAPEDVAISVTEVTRPDGTVGDASKLTVTVGGF